MAFTHGLRRNGLGKIMALAVTFPGQGSQQVGMGKALAEAFPQAKAVFDEVDEALGEKLSTIMFEGPEDTLTLTANAQPALMAVSVAACGCWRRRGFSPAHMRSLSPAIRWANIRRCAPPVHLRLPTPPGCCAFAATPCRRRLPPGEGAMAAIIGLEHGDVEAACREAAGRRRLPDRQ